MPRGRIYKPKRCHPICKYCKQGYRKSHLSPIDCVKSLRSKVAILEAQNRKLTAELGSRVSPSRLSRIERPSAAQIPLSHK